MKLSLYIPSKGRAGRVVPLQYLPHATTRVVVPTAELPAYRSVAPAATYLPCPAVGIGPTRQWIMEHARAAGLEAVVMLDDDITFAKRRLDDLTKFENMTSPDYAALFAQLASALATHAHVGVLAREGGNRITEHAVYNTRMLRVLCYRVPEFFKAGASFTRLHFMEDFDVTLQLLRAGLPNMVLCDYVSNQGGSNAAGGCSTYRTLEGQAQAAHGLKALHGDFVKVVQKTTKTAWNGATRTDVVIGWKKAAVAGGIVLGARA